MGRKYGDKGGEIEAEFELFSESYGVPLAAPKAPPKNRTPIVMGVAPIVMGALFFGYKVFFLY